MVKSFGIISMGASFYFEKLNGDKGIIFHLCLPPPFLLCFHKYEYNPSKWDLLRHSGMFQVFAESGDRNHLCDGG